MIYETKIPNNQLEKIQRIFWSFFTASADLILFSGFSSVICLIRSKISGWIDNESSFDCSIACWGFCIKNDKNQIAAEYTSSTLWSSSYEVGGEQGWLGMRGETSPNLAAAWKEPNIKLWKSGET